MGLQLILPHIPVGPLCQGTHLKPQGRAGKTSFPPPLPHQRSREGALSLFRAWAPLKHPLESPNKGWTNSISQQLGHTGHGDWDGGDFGHPRVVLWVCLEGYLVLNGAIVATSMPRYCPEVGAGPVPGKIFSSALKIPVVAGLLLRNPKEVTCMVVTSTGTSASPFLSSPESSGPAGFSRENLSLEKLW